MRQAEACRQITLHAENGALGCELLDESAIPDADFFDAAGGFVAMRPGGALFDSVVSFEVARSGKLSAVMEHSDRKGRSKLVRKCNYPLTAPQCADTIVTDLALLVRRRERFASCGRMLIRRFRLSDGSVAYTPRTFFGKSLWNLATGP